MTYGPMTDEFLVDMTVHRRVGGSGRTPAPRPGPVARAARPGPLSRALGRLRARLAAPGLAPADPDPIDHPAFRGMSRRELADLPFPRP